MTLFQRHKNGIERRRIYAKEKSSGNEEQGRDDDEKGEDDDGTWQGHDAHCTRNEETHEIIIGGGQVSPWKVGKKDSKGYPIIKSDTGKVVGHSTTKQKAEASVRARYAHYKGK